MVFGGNGPTGKLNSIETYYPEFDQWLVEKEFTLETELSHFACVNLNNRIYILGGHNGTGSINTVRYFVYEEK